MAAFSTGADWSFDGLPGAFEAETEPNSGNTSSEGTRDLYDTSTNEPPPKRRRTHFPPRQCRICLEAVEPTFHDNSDSPLPASMQPEPKVTYESEDGGRLLSPCKCKGSQKYVHEGCLNAWRRSDPLQKRNYWECPTCRYKYRLQRLTWSSWISSTAAQVALTVLILILSIFILGFVADPIINVYMYIDTIPIDTTGDGPHESLNLEDDSASWSEHMIKGLASLGLLGFANYFITSPGRWFRLGGTSVGGNGRNRMQSLNWLAIITILIGVATFLHAVWKGVRTWSRRTLESASERVIDVPSADSEDEED